MFFAVLAWVHQSSTSKAEAPVFSPVSSQKSQPLVFTAVLVAVILAGYSVFALNIKPMRTAKSIINSLIIAARPDPAGKVDAIIGELTRGIGLNTFGITEAREQANQVGNNIILDPGIASQDKQKYLAFVIQEMEKQRKEQPFDVRAMAFISNAYLAAGKRDSVLSTIGEALKISPRRQQFYFIAAEAYFSSNQHDKAIEALRTAYELDPEYTEAVHNLAIVLIASGRVKEGEDLVEKHFGTRIAADAKYAVAYRNIGDLGKMVQVLEKLVVANSKNAQYRAELGSAYFQVGQKEKAIDEFKKAAELEPGFKAQAEQIIEQIRNTIK